MSQADAVDSTTAPGKPAGSAVSTPPKRKRISAAKQWKLVEAAIERLVDLLDEVGADPDAEPSLGWPHGEQQVAAEHHYLMGYGTGDDREASGGVHLSLTGVQTDDEEPTLGWGADIKQTNLGCEVRDGDNEPSLGWSEAFAQGPGRLGNTSDREQECEDEGAQCEDEGADERTDNEPSLGSLDRMDNQTRWAEGDSSWSDAELDTADNEPSLGSLACVGLGGGINGVLPTYAAFDYGPGDPHHWDQERWAEGNNRDLEDEHDGREPDYPKPPKGYMQPEDLGPGNTNACDVVGDRLQPSTPDNSVSRKPKGEGQCCKR